MVVDDSNRQSETAHNKFLAWVKGAIRGTEIHAVFVKPSFLVECLKANRLVNHRSYVLPPKPQYSPSRVSAAKAAAAAKAAVAAAAVEGSPPRTTSTADNDGPAGEKMFWEGGERCRLSGCPSFFFFFFFFFWSLLKIRSASRVSTRFLEPRICCFFAHLADLALPPMRMSASVSLRSVSTAALATSDEGPVQSGSRRAVRRSTVAGLQNFVRQQNAMTTLGRQSRGADHESVAGEVQPVAPSIDLAQPSGRHAGEKRSASARVGVEASAPKRPRREAPDHNPPQGPGSLSSGDSFNEMMRAAAQAAAGGVRRDGGPDTVDSSFGADSESGTDGVEGWLLYFFRVCICFVNVGPAVLFVLIVGHNKLCANFFFGGGTTLCIVPRR